MIAVFWMALLFQQDSVRPNQPLELANVYRNARERSPRIAAARALTDAARARAPSARRPPDPQVQFGFMNYTLPGLRPMDVLGMRQLQLMQMLPLPGKLGLAGRVADASADAQAERARDVDWEVRSKTAMAFYDLYVTDESLAIDRETLRLLHDILRTTESMYRVGEGRQADVLRAQVEIARMVQDTIRMTTMRSAMSARLNAIIDSPAETMIGTPVLPAFPDSVPGLSAALVAAIADRPMVRAGERDLEAAAAQTKLARREIWPDLTIGIQYAERGGMGGTERMGSLMFGATLPVFARSRQLRMRDEAAAMQQMSRADLMAMKAETQAAIAEAHSNLTRARNLSTLYRTTLLPQAEAAITSAFAAYRTGSVDFMTLLDSRMSLNRYRKELVELEADEGKAWADLEMLMGRELFNPVSLAGRNQSGRN
jgi:outer membrane protein, heavy metal efflux system